MPDSLRKFISKTDPIENQPAEVRWLFELRRYRSLIEALGGNLRTDTADCYIGSNRGRVRQEERRNSWTEVLDRELLTCEKADPRTRSMGVDYEVQGLQVTVATVFIIFRGYIVCWSG